MAEESVHRWIVDSMEENVAAVEVDGTRVIFVPVVLLPSTAREGDVFQVVHIRGERRSEFRIERDDAARELLLARSREQARVPVSKGSGNIRL